MSYLLETYLRLDDIPELQLRLHDLELLYRPFKAHLDTLQRVIEDPVFAQEELARWKAKVADVETGMSTIKQAIEILNLPDDDEEIEYEDDDE